MKKRAWISFNLILMLSACSLFNPQDNINLEMILVEGGTFRMGDVWDDGSGEHDQELPFHPVTLDSYYIGKYEVTQKLYLDVMGNNPSFYNLLGDDNLPVENVCWYDAVLFCNKLSIAGKFEPVYIVDTTSFYSSAPWFNPIPDSINVVADFTKNGYRLPTEAEWEYAARSRGKENQIWSGTDNIDDLESYAWYTSNNDTIIPVVGEKLPNEIGIYDMSGNVAEWCWDQWGHYTSNHKINPTGPITGFNRVVRDGHWRESSYKVRTTNRSSQNPWNKSMYTGFRIARNAN